MQGKNGIQERINNLDLDLECAFMEDMSEAMRTRLIVLEKEQQKRDMNKAKDERKTRFMVDHV